MPKGNAESSTGLGSTPTRAGQSSSQRVVRLAVLPKQHDFIACTARETLYSGAFGAGKSRAVCLKLAMRASVKGAREGLCRKHLVTLKATTLKTLLENDGELEPVLPPGSYEHNKAEKSIRIKGGGEIVYFGLDDPEKIGSYNLTGCAVDESAELSEADYRTLQGRIRVPVTGLANQLYGACNPSTPSHHLAKRFGLAGGHVAQDGCVAIRTCTSDNRFLPADYVDSLSKLPPVARKRFFEGLWVGSEGLVYDQWDREAHVRERSGKWDKVIVACDDGYTNPFVALRLCVDNDGRVHVEAERYATGLLLDAKIAAVQSIAQDAEAVIVDPSSPDVIAEMRNVGLPVLGADNALLEGIARVQMRLAKAGDGRPRLTVDPSCENVVREFETYERKPGKEEPIKAFDHAMDALRYGVANIDAGSEAGVIVIGAGKHPDARQDGESVVGYFQRMRKNPDWGF